MTLPRICRPFVVFSGASSRGLGGGADPSEKGSRSRGSSGVPAGHTEGERALPTAIEGIAKHVQALITAELDRVGTPAPDSALAQAGLSDGLEIVLEYLQHKEAGLAFEHLLYMVEEAGLRLAPAVTAEIGRIGRCFPREPLP